MLSIRQAAIASTVLLFATSSASASVDPPPVQAAPFAPAIATLADKLEADFVVPELGAEYAKAIRDHLGAGDYNGITDPHQIASRLTADLQATKWEGHLRVRVAGSAPSSATRASSDELPPIKEAKWIAPQIAYISFRLMPDDPKVVAATERFMRDHASARVLIIDARENHGGGVGVANAIFKHLFAKRQVLAFYDQRTGVADASDDDPFEQPPTVTKAPGPPGIVRSQYTVIPDATETRLHRAKVFYLTSAKTGSAAEEMAQILKSTHRGVLIGERTAGAGHFGFFVPVGQGLEAFIPWGRVVDPSTGEDYEGKGVAPDIGVPADQALDEALRLARAPN
jgi:hypothetical protein